MQNPQTLPVMKTLGCLLLCVFVVSGCAASRPARTVQHSGFLADYSKLMPGMKGDANQVYHGPRAKDQLVFNNYKKIYIDPVAIYRKPSDDKSKMTPKDLEAIANNFYGMLVDALKPDYEIVRKVGLQSLRLTVAITNAEKDGAVLDTVSTLLPTTLVASTLFSYAADSPGFSGDITIETRVTDASTGEILVASVDRRLGAKNLSADLFDKWQTVNNAIAFWSKRQRYNFVSYVVRLGALRPRHDIAAKDRVQRAI